MRSTWSELQTDAQDYTRDTTTTGLTFLKKEMNKSLRFIYAELEKYIAVRTQTATTKKQEQFYHLPPDFGMAEAVSVKIGSVTYVLEPVESTDKWNALNAVQFSGSAIPVYYYLRRDDFGIYPEPQDSTSIITLDYHYRLRDLDIDDVTSGTMTVTNDDATITASGTPFTSIMVDRWFKGPDRLAYRITSFTDNANMELETKYEGPTTSGASYVIGESPELPPELHELIPYRAASLYFAGYKKNKTDAKYFENLFYTGDASMNGRDMREAIGGLLGAKRRYSRRSSSRIIRRKKVLDPFRTRIWGTTLS